MDKELKTNISVPVAPDRDLVEGTSRREWVQKNRVRVWRKRLVVLALVLSDVLVALLVWGVVAGLLYEIWWSRNLSEHVVTGIVPSVVVWVVMRALLGLYPGYGLDQVEQLRRQTYSVGANVAVIAVFALAFQFGDLLSRLLLGLGFLLLLPVAPLVRYLVSRGMKKLGLWGEPVAILGAGETGAQLVRTLHREWRLGFMPVAVFDFRLAPEGRVLEGMPYGGTVVDALGLARKQRIDTVIFAMPGVRREHLARFVDRARFSFQHVILIPDLTGVTTSAVVARDLVGVLGVEIKHNLLDPWVLGLKRTLELGATIVGGALILPIIVVLGLLVYLESGGNVLYKDRRIGKDGKVFWCLKFRTMVPDAQNMLERLLEANTDKREEYAKYHKLREDPRVTRVGSFLRKTSLDELPQLWNVWRGEMSLVGPRPYQPDESYKVGAAQSEILRVPPGITGLWQSAGRNQNSFSERVQLDTYYVRNWSVWLDLVILARTIKTVIWGQGAY